MATAVLVVGLLAAATMGGQLERRAVLAGAEVPDHRVVHTEAMADGRILTAHVVVEGTPDGDALVSLAAAIVDELRAEHDYGGLRVLLYDDQAYPSVGPSLGQLRDAPEGEWTKALRSTRDWRAHQSVVEVLDKDWDERPEKQQIELFVAWQEYQQQAQVRDDDEVTPAMADVATPAGFAKQSGVAEEELASAIEEVHAWVASGRDVEVVIE